MKEQIKVEYSEKLKRIGCEKGKCNIEELVKSRHSVRDYEDKELSKEVIEELQELIDKINKEENLHIQLILNDPIAFKTFPTHYSKFGNIRNYFALIGKKDDEFLAEKCGYFGEEICLKAQKLGLNTCWGGFAYPDGGQPYEVCEDEDALICTAMGIGAENGIPHECKTYDEVSVTSIEEAPDWYKKGMEFALLAPTVMNLQDFGFELVKLGKDGEPDEVRISSEIIDFPELNKGILKYHFELGAGDHNFIWVD